MMRNIRGVLFTAIAVLGLAASAQAVPIITVGNYDLLPNTPGQRVPLYVTGIVPNAGPTFPFFDGNVDGMLLGVAIGNGGPAFGGTPGPAITSIDVDSGPTIWAVPNSPAGHNAPHEKYFGQLAAVDFLTTSGWVNVSGGLLATLVIDTTGFSGGTYPLILSGGVVEEILGSEYTGLAGYFGGSGGNTIYEALYDGTAITIVPEPSSFVLAALGLIGLAAWGWRRKR